MKNEGGQRTFSFELDMTAINSRTDLGSDWKGTSFGNNIGLWFHGVDGLNTQYTADGKLSKFSYQKQGWYDIESEETQTVPEPAATAALGLFAATAAIGKLRKQSV